jgi:hypothetical protein
MTGTAPPGPAAPGHLPGHAPGLELFMVDRVAPPIHKRLDNFPMATTSNVSF